MVSRGSSEPTFECGAKSRGIHQQRDRESVRLILSSARGRCRPHWEFRTAVRDPSLFAQEPAADEPLIAYRRSVFRGGAASAAGGREYQENGRAIPLRV